MKVRILASATLLLFTMLILQSASGGRAANGDMDRTGAPGSGGNCMVYCHQGSGVLINPMMSVVMKDANNTAVTSYIPGATYTVEVTISSGGSPAGYGMQAVFLDGNDNNIGDFIATSTGNTQLTTIPNGREFLEHQGINSAGVFSATWEAPAAGSGDVTLHGLGLAVDGNGGTGGDAVTPSTQVAFTENLGTSVATIETEKQQFEVFPIPNNGHFYIQNKGADVAVETNIFDLTGARIYSNSSHENENAIQTIDLEGLSNGVYFIEFKTKNGIQSKKVVIKS